MWTKGSGLASMLRSLRGGKKLRNYSRNVERIVTTALQDTLAVSPKMQSSALDFLACAVSGQLQKVGAQWPEDVYRDGFVSGANTCAVALRAYFDVLFDSARNVRRLEAAKALCAADAGTIGDLVALPRPVSFRLFCAMHGVSVEKSAEQFILSGRASPQEMVHSIGTIHGFQELARRVVPKD